jgi:hypothetical protein
MRRDPIRLARADLPILRLSLERPEFWSALPRKLLRAVVARLLGRKA